MVVKQTAQAALKGSLRRDLSVSQRHNLPDIAFIDARFMFLWKPVIAMVQSTKRLAILTVLLSFSVAALGCINICSGFMTERRRALQLEQAAE